MGSHPYAAMVVLIPLAAAVAALAARGMPAGPWLRAVAVGSWFASGTWLLADLSEVPRSYQSLVFGSLVRTEGKADSTVFSLIGDVLGIAAVIILLAAAGKNTRRGGRAARRPQVLLLCGTVLGPAIWYVNTANYVSAHRSCCSVTAAFYAFNSRPISVVEIILAAAVAVLVAVYALGIRDQVVGGATLAGWLAVALFTFLHFATTVHATGVWAALNWLAGAVLVASLVLTIRYLRGKEATPAPQAA
jgi:hypothetical protein